MSESIPVRVGFQQRVLPSYRIPFFDALAEICPNGLGVFAGKPRKDEALDTGARPMVADLTQGKNIHILEGLFYMCWQSGIMDWLERWKPDVLIMEANPRYVLSRSAARWMKSRGGKVIGWGLGSPRPAGHFSWLRLVLRRRFVSRFDAIVTYSQLGAQEYARLGFPHGLVFTAPNAVAPKPKHQLPGRDAQYRSGRPVILFVGRLQARKRVAALIRACSLLPPIFQPFLRIVGDGPLHRELENLAEEIHPDTHFYGAQYGTDLEKHFREADLFVQPGTGGLAVQQAMSFGLPVIVGVSDGTQSDLVRGENGWILPDASPETLASYIETALSDIRQLRIMGRASYRIVSEEINLENMVDAFRRAVLKVLEG